MAAKNELITVANTVHEKIAPYKPTKNNATVPPSGVPLATKKKAPPKHMIAQIMSIFRFVHSTLVMSLHRLIHMMWGWVGVVGVVCEWVVWGRTCGEKRELKEEVICFDISDLFYRYIYR